MLSKDKKTSRHDNDADCCRRREQWQDWATMKRTAQARAFEKIEMPVIRRKFSEVFPSDVSDRIFKNDLRTLLVQSCPNEIGDDELRDTIVPKNKDDIENANLLINEQPKVKKRRVKTGYMTVISEYLKQEESADRINLPEAIGLEANKSDSISALRKQAFVKFFDTGGSTEIDSHYFTS